MRFMTYQAGDVAGLAASRDGSDWHGLAETAPRFPGHLEELLARGGTALGDAATELLRGAPVDPAAVTVLPPLRHPGRILCIGLNYAAHVAEAGMGTPEHPTVFVRYPDSVVGHGAPIVRPAASEQFDYEAELAAIIGTGGRHIARDRALEHVAGYAIFNDGSVRDAQKRTTQWTLGKNHDASGSFGPWMVSADALPPGGTGLRITGRLNGDIVQDGTTDDLVFDLPRLIADLSAVMTLNPGDVIVTGTPSGVAMGMETPRWLRPGDRFDITIDGIGTLSNPVIDEAP